MGKTQGTNEADEDRRTDLTDLRFVGPVTATALAAAGYGPAHVREKRLSYEMLIDADVNPGVAAKIRREHSLSWSFEGTGSSLDQRSTQVRGLKDEERAWIAASTGDWENAEPATGATTDGGGTAQDAERAWRERSRPEPVTTIADVGGATADRLAEAGITSIRSLAIANPSDVARSLDIDRDRVAAWCDAARELSE